MSIDHDSPHTRGTLAAVCGIAGHTIGHRIIMQPVAAATTAGRRSEIYRHPDHDVDCHVVVSDNGSRRDGTAVFYGPLEDCRVLLARSADRDTAPSTPGPARAIGARLRGAKESARAAAHALRHGPVRNTAVHYRVTLPDESWHGTFIVHGLPGEEGLGDGERFGPRFVPADVGVPELGGQTGRDPRHELVGLTVADGGLTPTRRRTTVAMTVEELADELAALAERYDDEDREADAALNGSAVYDADGCSIVHHTHEGECDACGEIHLVEIVGPYDGTLAFCRDTQACKRRRAAQRRFDDMISERIRSMDDRVYARHATAYSTDRYGVVANPDAPADLRELMTQLALWMLARDGQWPTWWRMPGQPPDRERFLYEEARGLGSAA